MAKKRYYDDEGNEIRSRPSKSIYQNRWSGVLILLLIGVGIFIGLNISNGEKSMVIESVDSKSKEVEKGKSVNDHENSELTEEVMDEEIDNQNAVEEINEEPTYTYEDFEGTYVTFEGEPYRSPLAGMSNIIVMGDDFYKTFNRWDLDMTSNILKRKIEGNVLTLYLDSDESEEWGLHNESGVEQFKLIFEDDRKILHSITNDHSLYSMSIQDLQTHYNQLESDYARIIMTTYGEPSLDQWAVWNAEYGTPIINVRYTSAGDATEVSSKVSYPADVTHLDLTTQGMAFGVITYSSHGDGYITRYPMPLHYHQEDQSDEGYRQLAQNSLDDASKIYVEPFEAYSVADFIGHVEFVYE